MRVVPMSPRQRTPRPACAGSAHWRKDSRRRNTGKVAMRRSLDRILTTHVGSLPRPDDLHAMAVARGRGKDVDEAAYAARLRQAVTDVVRKQVSLGIDIVDDGELSKP